MKKLAVLNLVLVLSLMLGAVAWAADDILGDANAYFSGGTKNITASALYDNLNDGDDSNNPYIISVRSAEDYEKGHIPGAVRMDPKTMFTPENLATIPADKQVVVYCYTGQTSSQVVSALNTLGYDAYSMSFGFCAWNSDPNANSKCFDTETMGQDYPTTTDMTPVPMIANPPATPLAETTQAAANAYFSGGTKNINADALYDNLNDGDDSNNPTIISVRSLEDYNKGHIPGAIWLDSKTMFSEGGLMSVDPAKPVVVYCYTGQSGSQVTSVLNMLGYDASNLLFGMEGWTADNDVRVKYFDPAQHLNEFPYEGTAAGSAAEEAAPEEAAAEETTTEEVAPVTMPETGGVPFPVEGVLLGFGALTAAAGLYLNRRKSA